MTWSRWTIALSVLGILLVLLAFNQHRWSIVASCHARGGVWDGADSRCRLIPARIFIERGLTRT